jgi:mono/diheme cytochrome c family protein
MSVNVVKPLMLVVACLAMLPSLAWAAGNAANGHVLARVWCSDCHLVDADGSGKDAAPPLAEIAQRGAPAQLEARQFIAAPHPPMPNFELAREQIDDIVAYLNSLAKP